MPAIDVAEKYFTAIELAQYWNIHPNTVRKLFERVPDVVRISMPSEPRKDDKPRRRYVTLRIPQSVAERVLRGLRGLGPRQEIAIEKPASKPAVDPCLTGLDRRQAEMRERNKRKRRRK